MISKKIKIFLLLLIAGVFGIVFYFTLTEIQKKEAKPENLKISLTKEEKIKGDFIIIFDDLSSKVLKENFLNDSAFKIIKLKQKISQTPIDKTEQLETEPSKIDDLKIEETNKLSGVNISNGQLKITDKLLYWGYEIASPDRSIDTIIIHSSYDALGTDPYSVDGIIYEYKIYGVSPHYLIDRNGTIFRLIKEANIAYHAGGGKMPDGRTDINSFSIGIELINTKTVGPNEIQYSSLVGIVKSLKSKYGIKNILGHSEISPDRKTDPWNFDWQKFNEMLKN